MTACTKRPSTYRLCSGFSLARELLAKCITVRFLNSFTATIRIFQCLENMNKLQCDEICLAFLWCCGKVITSKVIKKRNVVIEWLTLLLRIWEVMGSNLAPKTGYPE
jgi:hypothetical protein